MNSGSCSANAAPNPPLRSSEYPRAGSQTPPAHLAPRHTSGWPFPGTGLAAPVPGAAAPSPPGGPVAHQLSDRHLVQVAETQIQLVAVQLVLEARSLPAAPRHDRRDPPRPGNEEGGMRYGGCSARPRHTLPRPRPRRARRGGRGRPLPGWSTAQPAAPGGTVRARSYSPVPSPGWFSVWSVAA